MKKSTLPLLLLTLTICLFTSYIFSQGTWTQKAFFGGTARQNAVGFSIGTKGYIGTGRPTLEKDFWEWDQATNVWTQKADFGGTKRSYAVGFSIGTKGYIGTGQDLNSARTKDFWEWDQATNIWIQKANFGGTGRYQAVGFSIGNKGYIGTGSDSTAKTKDFWEWNSVTNIWTQKANFSGTARQGAVGFSIGTKGYIGTGEDGSNGAKDFWEWDQVTNTWIQKANFGGLGRYWAVGFSISNKGYIGTGYATPDQQDFWEWNQATNVWTQRTVFSGTARQGAVGFSIGTKGYIGTGGGNVKDFWEYDRCGGFIITTSQTNVTNCNGSNGSATATPAAGSPPYTYSWNTNPVGTTATIINLPAGAYIATVTDGNGCTASAAVNITQLSVSPPPICLVTVDSASQYNQIAWEKTSIDTAAIDSFIIYRELTTNNYVPIGRVPKSAYSVFVDLTASPNTTTRSYKLSAIDTCNNESALSTHHKTIFLQGNGVNLSWNSYVGNIVNYYRIMRDSSGTGNFKKIDSIPGSNTVYTDVSPPLNTTNTQYVIESIWSINCVPSIKNPVPMGAAVKTTKSNTFRVIGNGIHENSLESQISIYPNPNHGTFTLQINNSQFQNSKMKIFNALGEVVYSINSHDPLTVINLSVNPGIYHLQVITDKGTVNRKIIIQ